MEEQLESLKITEEEKEAIKAYQDKANLNINPLLEKNLQNEITIEKEFYLLRTCDEKSLKIHMETIKKIYSAIIKYTLQNGNASLRVHRALPNEAIQNLKKGKIIGKFMSTSESETIANDCFNLHRQGNKAIAHVHTNEDVPYIYINDILDTKKDEKEYLLSPFTQVDEIEPIDPWNGTNYYSLSVKKAELPELDELDEKKRNELEKEIFSECQEANNNLKKYSNLQKKLEDSYAIKKGKFLKYQQEKDLEEKKEIHKEIDGVEREIKAIEIQMKEKEIAYSAWKEKIVICNMASCREIEKNIHAEVAKEKEKIEETKRKEQIAKEIRSLQQDKKVRERDFNCVLTNNSSLSIKVAKLEKLQKKFKKDRESLGIAYDSDTDLTKKLKYTANNINEYAENIKSKLNKININEQTIDDKVDIYVTLREIERSGA